MYIGEYSHTLDGKGRTTIPMKFRAKLGEVFYITKGFDECLFVFDEKGWENFVNDQLTSNTGVKKANFRYLQRVMFSSTIECTLDKQGRVLIPNNLREYAGLEKDLIIIGVSDKAEIWDKEKWEEYNTGHDGDLSDIADSLEELLGN